MAKTPGTDKIDEDQIYSEMWMGTYPELPSYIVSSGEDLQQYLNKHKEELIGESVLKKFGSDLPYLPKVGNTSTWATDMLLTLPGPFNCKSITAAGPSQHRVSEASSRERPGQFY